MNARCRRSYKASVCDQANVVWLDSESTRVKCVNTVHLSHLHSFHLATRSTCEVAGQPRAEPVPILQLVPMLVLALATDCGPHPPFRRHVSRFTAKPATIFHRQPSRARLLACIHPISRPTESQRHITPHWHVAVPSLAPARLVALAVGAQPFLCPAAGNIKHTDRVVGLQSC